MSSGSAMAHEVRMLIDGKVVDAEGGATFEVVESATGVVLGGVADGSHADMARAVSAGRHVVVGRRGR